MLTNVSFGVVLVGGFVSGFSGTRPYALACNFPVSPHFFLVFNRCLASKLKVRFLALAAEFAPFNACYSSGIPTPFMRGGRHLQLDLSGVARWRI